MSLQAARRSSRLSGALQHMWAAASLETSASAASPSGHAAALCTAPTPTASEARSQFAAAGTSVRAGAAPQQQQQQPQRWRHTLLPRPLGPQGHSALPRRGWANAAAQAAPAEPPRQQQQQEAASPSSAADAGASEGLQVSERAAQRLRELAASGGGAPLVLRLSVEGGGCSGFQYEFALASGPQPGDRVFGQSGGVAVACDDLSLEFLRGATVDWESDLMRSAFVVAQNPNAAASCGCGSSFTAK